MNAQAEREEASLYDDDVTAQLDTDDVGPATPINDNDDLLKLAGYQEGSESSIAVMVTEAMPFRWEPDITTYVQHDGKIVITTLPSAPVTSASCTFPNWCAGYVTPTENPTTVVLGPRTIRHRIM